jgi:hypothetical protein
MKDKLKYSPHTLTGLVYEPAEYKPTKLKANGRDWYRQPTADELAELHALKVQLETDMKTAENELNAARLVVKKLTAKRNRLKPIYATATFAWGRKHYLAVPSSYRLPVPQLRKKKPKATEPRRDRSQAEILADVLGHDVTDDEGITV